jgi:hypothetical protein
MLDAQVAKKQSKAGKGKKKEAYAPRFLASPTDRR